MRGRGATQPVGETARNFALAVPPALVVSAFMWSGAHASLRGTAFAVCSGMVTSGVGYVIWYAALPGLTGATAALVQLAVPLIAAAAGVAILGESVTRRLVVATILILGGIALAVLGRKPSRR